MPRAVSTHNYVISNRHIMRTALVLHDAVPQLYNALHLMHVPSGMDVIHAINGTYTHPDGTFAPIPNSKWYSNSFQNYGIEDWAWVTACQSAQALQEFEEDKTAKELPHNRVLMRVLNVGLCDMFIRTTPGSRVVKKTNVEQRQVSVIRTHL